VIVLIITVLACSAYARNLVWRNDVALWTDVVRKSPRQQRGYVNLCVQYAVAKNNEQALLVCGKAIAIKPVQTNNLLANAYVNRGAVYSDLGREKEAREDYLAALAVSPNNWWLHNNLGNAYAREGQFDTALSHYAHAISLNPSYASAYYNRGVVANYLNDRAQAIDDFTRALDLDPRNADALLKRGSVYAAMGRRDDALVDFQRACAQGSPGGCEAAQRLREHRK